MQILNVKTAKKYLQWVVCKKCSETTAHIGYNHYRVGTKTIAVEPYGTTKTKYSKPPQSAPPQSADPASLRFALAYTPFGPIYFIQ